MSGGILGSLDAPYGAGILGGMQPQQGAETGLLGRLSQALASNSGLLMGYGAGGFEGAMQGMQMDEHTRLIHRKEAEDEQRRVAMQQAAQKLGIDPVLAQASPEIVGAVAARKYAPKELSFEERQFNKLSPEQQAAYRQREFLGGGDNTEYAKIQQRQQAAGALGLTRDHPAYQSYVLTGKMPREDQAPLTATDKKAILEADEGVEAATNAIDALEKAKSLSGQAYEGFTAGPRAAVTGMWGNEGGVATQELDNLVGTNALSQLKAIFGGNPTEGERAIMMELQGASSKPHEVRVKIYERAQEMARRRLAFNKQRADALRGGSFYGGQGRGAQGQSQQAPAQGPIQVDGYTIRQR